MTDFGHQLRKARVRAGLSQAALAGRAGTSQPTLSMYESGRKQPSLDTLQRLLRAAGARLTVEPASVRVAQPSVQRKEQRAHEFLQALELAEALPRRRGKRLHYPRLPEAR